jgi:hypothetical protein
MLLYVDRAANLRSNGTVTSLTPTRLQSIFFQRSVSNLELSVTVRIRIRNLENKKKLINHST